MPQAKKRKISDSSSHCEDDCIELDDYSYSSLEMDPNSAPATDNEAEQNSSPQTLAQEQIDTDMSILQNLSEISHLVDNLNVPSPTTAPHTPTMEPVAPINNPSSSDEKMLVTQQKKQKCKPNSVFENYPILSIQEAYQPEISQT